MTLDILTHSVYLTGVRNVPKVTEPIGDELGLHSALHTVTLPPFLSSGSLQGMFLLELLLHHITC